MFDRHGIRKYLNGNERLALKRAIQQEPDDALRAFLLTLFHTGCRISEGLNLTAGRVDLSGKAVIFETLKQRKRGCFRALQVPEDLLCLLRPLVDGKPPQTRVWGFSRSTGYRLVKGKMHEAAVHGGMACPRGVRHGYAVACVSKKIPLTTIQKWLGHARLETTGIYLNVTGEEERDLAGLLW